MSFRIAMLAAVAAMESRNYGGPTLIEFAPYADRVPPGNHGRRHPDPFAKHLNDMITERGLLFRTRGDR